MTQEEKQLLLKDLCGRVIYNTKVRVIGDWFYEEREPYDSILTFMIMKTFEENDNLSLIIKPYLRPMSSTTEEERKEFQAFHCVDVWHPYFYQQMCNLPNLENMFNWLNKHHFDFRGLISKGLALEAPEGMYKTK